MSLARFVPALLRERLEFRRFWLGQTISLFGDQITLIALPLLAVYELDATAAEMSYLTAAALLPNLLFSLPAGVFADRNGRRRLTMIAADVARAALLAAVPASVALGVLSLPLLSLIAFLIGSAGVLFGVCYLTLFAALVPAERYVSANSLLSGSRALSSVAGPSVGGLLVQAATAPLAIALDAVSFLVSACFLLRISPTEPPREEARRGLLLDGVRYILHEPLVRAALAATATLNLFNFAFAALFYLYASRDLDLSPGTLGLILGAAAVGGLLGSLIAGRVVDALGIGPTFVLGCLLFPAPLMLVPLAGGPPALILLMLFAADFFAGLGVMILDISAMSLFAAVIPDRLRARVSGAYMLVNYGVRPLGALLGGVLAGALGMRPALWIVTAGGLLGVLWLLPTPLPRLHGLPEPARQAEA
jgi:MFS family permease